MSISSAWGLPTGRWNLYNAHMSEKCLKCFRPVQSCYCSDIHPIQTGVKFIFLMHPKEAYKQKTGTGRLASLSLVDSEIIIAQSFDHNKRTQQLISDSSYFPMLLYPGKDAHYAESFDFQAQREGRTLLVFLVDATWRLARQMIFRSPSLQKLPKLSFSHEYRSAFAIKTQPEDYCLSTIETSYYLIKELQKSGICHTEADPSGLMEVFQKMVKFQEDCRDERLGRGPTEPLDRSLKD